MSRQTQEPVRTTADPLPVSADRGAHPMARGRHSARIGAAVTVIATRTVRKYIRSPELLGMSLGSGAIFMLLFRYIFGGAIHFGRVPYVDFLIPGMVMTSVLITGANLVAIGVAEDRQYGAFDRLRSLPVPRLALPAGRVLGDTLVGTWGIAATAAMGFLVGFEFHGTLIQALLAFALCVVCGFAFVWIFVCIGLAAGSVQAAQGMSMLTWPILFVSSAYVQTHTLPSWMRPLAEHQPITVMCNAVRSLALGDPRLAGLGHTTAYWTVLSLVWAAGIVAVFAPIAVALHRRSS
jgi:ABC-2 type transport system permease protein